MTASHIEIQSTYSEMHMKFKMHMKFNIQMEFNMHMKFKVYLKLTAYHRLIIHIIWGDLGLVAKSIGECDKRRITVYQTVLDLRQYQEENDEAKMSVSNVII